MSAFLKVMVVLNLLLAVGAAVLSWLIFDQREIFKERLQTLEAHAPAMAKALEWGKFDTTDFADEPEKWGNWPNENNKDPARMKTDIQDYRVLGDGLKAMESIAADRVELMKINRAELDMMIARLTDTNRTLTATRVDLDNTRDELTNMTNQKNDLDDKLKAEQEMVRNLETEKQTLQADLNTKVEENSKLNADLAGTQKKLEDTEAELFKTDEELRTCLAGQDGDIINKVEVAGKVLAIEPQWNFVVFDLGRKQNVQINGEAMVHRNEELVGKINVNQVEESVSIGTIDKSWSLGSVKVGDEVIFLR